MRLSSGRRWSGVCAALVCAVGFAVPAGAAAPADLRLVSYYPSTDAWTGMWTSWRPATLDRDFARIAGVNANGVRLIVAPSAFGYPLPDTTMTDRLAAAVDLADAHGLRVELTLFDLAAPYADPAGSALWAAAVLSPFAGDGRIAAVELRNEIDPADAQAMRWARTLLPQVKALAPGVPVTVSARSGLDLLRALRDALGPGALDFFSYHLYAAGDPSRVHAELAAAKALVAPVPLVIGETGASSAPSAALAGASQGRDAQEAAQATWFRAVGLAARRLGLGAPAVWTANDFAPGAIPPAAGVAVNPAEYALGLFRTDGFAKPAAAAVREIFAGQPIATGFNGGFEEGGSLPFAWRRFAADAAGFARDVRTAHGGRASARLSATGGSSAAVPALITSPPAYVPTADRACTASAWVRGRRATGSTRIALAWFDLSGSYLGQAESASMPAGTSAWRRLTVRGSTPREAAAVQIHLKSAHNRGSAWFDDVRFAC